MRLPAPLVERFRGALEGRRVCVTGGCGFIGGHLVDALLSVGARLTVIDDLSSASLDHLAGLIDLEPARVRLVRASILDPDALADACEGAEVVFHLAAIGSVPRSIDDPARTWVVNATGTVRVLDAARHAGARLVVNSSSSSIYGDTPEMPKTETMPPAPASPYAASKLAGEGACRAWSGSFGLATASLRYFNVFGPRQPADSDYAAVIPAFARAMLDGRAPTIFGDGRQTRDFTPVDNAVAANLLCAAAGDPPMGDTLNIGLGARTSLLDLARLLGESLGASTNGQALAPEHAPARAGDVRDSLASIDAARARIGYEPVVTFESGLADTAAWYRDHAGHAPDNAPNDAPTPSPDPEGAA